VAGFIGETDLLGGTTGPTTDEDVEVVSRRARRSVHRRSGGNCIRYGVHRVSPPRARRIELALAPDETPRNALNGTIAEAIYLGTESGCGSEPTRHGDLVSRVL
jgi:hypothetical protein